MKPREASDTDVLSQSRAQDWLRAKRCHRRAPMGVCFRNLDCIGRRTSTQYQATFANALGRLLSVARSQEQAQILSGFEGLIKPGEMLSVLGRPGSGCSTFLKALSGETHGFELGRGSLINYHGMDFKTLHREFFGRRSYLAELDVHFPELTLGQTLEFAALARAEHDAKFKDAEGTARIMASLFGLASPYNTLIGNVQIWGVSGGEKRRTSIAEAYNSGAQLQCWDNSTRGLDSLTAKRFIEVLRQSTDVLQTAVAMSLYQASESMYKQFDKVMLLYEGHEIYFGPVDAAAAYFEKLGFEKPSSATTPDFLTSLTNPAERIARPGWRSRLPVSPRDFVEAWGKSDEAKMLCEDIASYESAHPLSVEKESRSVEKRPFKANAEGFQPPPTFFLSIYGQIAACMRRSFQRMRNSPAPVYSIMVANALLGIIIGSAFFNLDESSSSLIQRSTLLFFVTMLNSFVPAFEIELMWAQRPIVEKHHRYAFYHPFTERVAFMILDFPVKFVASFMLHLPIYWMTNLQRTGSSFSIYWFFMLVNLVTMTMLFRMIGAISKSHNATVPPVSLLTLLCVLYTGFVVPPPYMVSWLGWFRYINPIAYTYESVMINELRDRRFKCLITIPDGPSYSHVSVAEKLCSEVGRRVGTDEVDGTDYLGLKYGYVYGHLWRNMGILFAMMVCFCIVHLFASEYLPAKKSRGEVLMFKNPPKNKTPQPDEEAPEATTPTLTSDAVSADKIVHQRGSHPHDHTARNRNGDQTSLFYWSDVSYTVKVRGKSRKILADISGWLEPGSLTVLMGTTGAGKTTLLDVLAGQERSGETSGNFYVEGRQRHEVGNFRRRMAYVQQDDIHLPTATIREALQFSALLRQPASRSKTEKLAYVDYVLDMLGMEAYADAVIGVTGEGLNVEQRKRLSIGVELAAMPDLVLFLDEPTSGLDSQTAWSICTLLRKLVDNGHTILCTVHQPSAQLFNYFDRLLLLQGGETLYFGEIGRGALVLKKYFESKGSRICSAQENLAEWMMDITESSFDPKDDHQPWIEKWKSSEERQQVLKQLSHLKSHHGSKAATVTDESSESGDECAANSWSQLVILVERTFRDQWRDPVYLYTKITTCIGLSLFNGISFYKVDKSIQGLISLLFSCFLMAQLFSNLSILVIRRSINGRHLFEARERDSKLYTWVIFWTGNVVVEITWLTLISVLVFCCWYYPTGMYTNGIGGFEGAERGCLSFFLVWAFLLWTGTLAQAFSAAIDQPECGFQIANLCFWLSIVFCGILVTPSNLDRFWIFMYRVSPLIYSLEGLAIAGVSGIQVECSSVELLNVPLPDHAGTCGEYLADYMRETGGFVTNSGDSSGPCIFCPISQADVVLRSLGMSASKVTAWRNAGILICYIAFNVLATFAFYYFLRVPGRKRGGRQK